jgi:hypothetical protein
MEKGNQQMQSPHTNNAIMMQHSPNIAYMQKLKHIQSQKLIKIDTHEIIHRELTPIRQEDNGEENIFNLLNNASSGRSGRGNRILP